MKIQLLAAVGLMVPMLAAMPVYAAPQTMPNGVTFDPEYYAANNPDVVTAYGTTDPYTLFTHFCYYGKAEGRAAYEGDQDAVLILQALTAQKAAEAAGTDAAAESTTTAATTAFGQYIDSLLGQITTADMTQDQKLRAAWNWLLNHASYKRTYDTPSGDWTQQYASELLTTGKGNCYRYAAAFAYLAKGLGYDAEVRTGQISAARGGVTPHGWVVLTINGTEYICDPDMADAKNSPNAYYMKTFAQYPVKPLTTQNTWEINY